MQKYEDFRTNNRRRPLSSRSRTGPRWSCCQPWRSSWRQRVVSGPASCARSMRCPWPCGAPRAWKHHVSESIPPSLTEQSCVPLNNILVLPADLVAETTDGAVLAAGLQSQDTEGLGNDHLLLLVVGGRDTLEDLESFESGGTAGGLVGNHATDGLVEDSRRGAEVEGT